jgi:tetratricopeptide (TPR) repeat protein
LKNAGPCYERAAIIQQNALGPNNFDVISSIAKLCQFETQVGDWTKADKLCTRIISYAQRCANDRRALANSFKSLYDYYKGRRDLEEAEILVKQAEEMTHKQTADHDLELAVVLDGVGVAYGERPQAEPLLCMALAIRAASLPPTHMALASSCESLAKLYLSQGKAGEAEPLFRQAYQISAKASGPAKPETLQRADSFAQCCVRLGKTQEAEQVYRKALDAAAEGHATGGPFGMKLEIALADLMTRQGRYQEAAPLLSQALKTQESLQGPQSASLAPILEAYADVLDKTNRHGEASKLHNRAKSIRM